MKNISVRNVFTILSIIVISLLFIGLGLGGRFFGFDLINFYYLGLLYQLAPLIILATLLSYVFGSSKKDKNKQAPSKKTSKIIATISLIGAALSYVSARISSNIGVFDTDYNKFFFQNFSTGVMFIAIIAAVWLISKQNYVYWPFWSSSDQKDTDERQKQVRHRVFEKSYRILFIILIFTAFQYNQNDNYLEKFLVVWLVFMFLSIPSLIATFQKDS